MKSVEEAGVLEPSNNGPGGSSREAGMDATEQCAVLNHLRDAPAVTTVVELLADIDDPKTFYNDPHSLEGLRGPLALPAFQGASKPLCGVPSKDMAGTQLSLSPVCQCLETEIGSPPVGR